jgi:hypothetical protein
VQPIRRALSCVFLVACVPEVTPSNPYDPELPVEQQQRATVVGMVQGGLTPRPLEGATIELAGPTSPPGGEVVTDDTGAFAFGDLIPGKYLVVVSHAAHFGVTLEISLAPGEARQLDLSLAPLPAELGGSTGHLNGRALLEAEQGQSAPDHSGIIVEVTGTGVRTVTNGAGDFDLFLNEGTYDVSFTAADHVALTVDDVSVLAAMTTTVPNSPLVLAANPGSISGAVVLEDPPVAGHGGVVISSGSQTTQSAPDGTFTLTGIAPGMRVVTASLPDWTTVTSAPVVVRGGTDTALAAPLALPRSRGRISGRALLAGAQEHSGITIHLTGTSHAVPTTQSGDFVLEGVAVGVYELTATRNGYIKVVRAGVTVAADAAEDVGDLTLALRDGDVSIDGGGDYTRDTEIDLDFTAPPGTTEVEISGDLDAAESTDWRTYASSLSVFLDGASDGVKRVAVRFRDADLIESDVFAATIVLDRAAPEIAAVRIDGDARFSKDPQASVALSFTFGDAVSGVVKYQLAESDSFTATTPPLEDVVLSRTHTFTDPSTDQARRIYVRYWDAAGNVTTSVFDEIELDRAPPSLTSFTAACASPVDTSYCPSSVAALTIVATGASEMALSSTPGLTNPTFRDLASSVTWLLDGDDGAKQVALTLRDLAGNTTTEVVRDLTLDRDAPRTPRVTIDQGLYARVPAITLTLSAVNAFQMRIDMIDVDGTTTTGTWKAYGTADGLTLGTTLRGQKRIEAVFRDRAGNESERAVAQVIFDDKKPAAPVVTINNGATVTANETASVSIIASDEDTGVARMYISRDGTFTDGVLEDYVAAKSWDLDGSAAAATVTRSVHVKVYDRAGNESDPVIASLLLDREAPSLAPISLNGGLSHAPSTGVTVTLDATDPGSGAVTDVMLSESPVFSGASWIAYPCGAGGCTVPWVLSSANGPKRLYAKVRDSSGRESNSRDDDITLDTEPPTALSLRLAGTGEPGFTFDTEVAVEVVAYDNLSIGAALDIALGEAALDCAAATYDRDFTGCTAPPCSTLTSFDLPPGDGVRTVKACVRDAAGWTAAAPLSATIFLDTVEPDPVAGVTIVPGSREALLSWAVTDDNPGGSGVSSYYVSYGESFEGPQTTLLVTGGATSVLISGLDNRRNYAFNLTSVDRAGLRGFGDSGVQTVLGIAGQRIAQLDDPLFDNPLQAVGNGVPRRVLDNGHPRLVQADGRLWLFRKNYKSPAYVIELRACNVGRVDCRDTANWQQLSDISAPDPVYHPAVALAVSASRVLYAHIQIQSGGSQSRFVNIQSCLRSRCINRSDFSYGGVQQQSPDNAQKNAAGDLALAAAGERYVIAYSRKDAGGIFRPVISTCDPSTPDCGMSDTWPLSHLTSAPECAPSLAMDIHCNPEVTLDDTRLWSVYVADGRTRPVVVTCPFNTHCNTADDFSTYDIVTHTARPGILIDNPIIVRTPARLYALWRVAPTDGSANSVEIARCELSSGCDATADWTPGTLFQPEVTGNIELYRTLGFSMLYAGHALHATYWDGRAVRYAICDSPDTADCNVRSNWRRMDLDPDVVQDVYPGLAAYGTNVFTVYDDDANNQKLMLPRTMTPTTFAAAPAVLSYFHDQLGYQVDVPQVRSGWSGIPYLDGYAQVYGELPAPDWENVVQMPDVFVERSTIERAAGLDTYTALRGVDASGEGDDSRAALIVPFEGIPDLASGALTDVQYSFATESTRLFLAYRDSAGLTKLTRCDTALADCTLRTAWSTPVTVLTGATSSSQIVVTPNRLLVIGDDSATNRTVLRTCDRAAPSSPTDCTTGGSGAGLWPTSDLVLTVDGVAPTATYGGGMLLVLARAASNGNLSAYRCLDGSDCDLGASWASTLINNQPDNFGFSVAAGGSGFTIVRELPATIIRSFCSYAGGCNGVAAFAPWSTVIAGDACIFPDCSYDFTPYSTRVTVDTSRDRVWVVTHEDRTLFLSVAYCDMSGSSGCSASGDWTVVDSLFRRSTLASSPFQGVMTGLLARAGTAYLAFNTASDLWMATCNFECWSPESWYIAPVLRETSLGGAARNQPFFALGPTDRIALTHGVLKGSQSYVHVMWDGKAVPRP